MFRIWLGCLSSLLLLRASGARQTVTVLDPPLDWRNESITEDHGRVCGSFDIRNSVRGLQAISGCRIIEGYLQILLFENAKEENFKNLSFPELTEITEYFLIYRVNGIKSLGTLFPNLSVIRGRTLLADYALVVYSMFALEDLGLQSLTAISRGAVRIEDNEELCYLDTIAWSTITASGSEHFIANKPMSECPGCKEDCVSGLCWSSRDCQPTLKPKCHPFCLGGCTGPRSNQCNACRRVRLHGDCLEACPADRLEYLGHHCITPKQCSYMGLNRKAQYWPFENSCVSKCRQGSTNITDENGKVIGCKPCREQCPCNAVLVNSIAAAQHLSGCTHINGSIEIEISGGEHIVKELEENLGMIEEIYENLKIQRSFALVSLDFLKNLRVIRGRDSPYSLVIHNNPNLKALWNLTDKPHGIKIKSGRLFIHNNPKLCLTDIEKLNQQAGLDNFTNHEVSQESNGNKSACDHGHQYNLKVTITSIFSRSAIIEWEQLKEPNATEETIRYVAYYIEAPEKNILPYDERGACWGSDYVWKIVYISTADPDSRINLHIPFTRLQPHTQYAYYLTMATAYNVQQSEIQYFRTKPDRPSLPTIVKVVSTSHNDLFIQWEAPQYPNGDLKYFMITGTWLKDDPQFLDQRDYCIHPMTFDDSQVNEESNFILKRKRKVYDCCGNEENFEINDNIEYKSHCEKQEDNFISKQFSSAKEEACKDYIHTYLSKHLLEQKDDMQVHGQKAENKPKTPKPSKEIKPPWGYIDSSVPDTNKKQKNLKSFIYRVESNITEMQVSNLRHFTKYAIKIMACRDSDDNDDKKCSFASMVTVRTKSKPGADDISSIDIDIKPWNQTIGNVEVHWSHPEKPNGIIVTYYIEYRLVNSDDTKLRIKCITRKAYELGGGKNVVRNLTSGKYAFRIRAASLAGMGAYSQTVEFHVREPMNPTFLEQIIAVALGVPFLISLIGALVFYLRFRFKYKRRLVASVNPDYDSSSHYIEDHWELKRERVSLKQVLGQGSFGKVYEGALDQNIRCAVKMVNPNLSNRERDAFLNEASVMKTFSDAFHVVRLLGVVSRGEPPLVVMELMALGDLKSYLRARREDNDGPDLDQMLMMAAQVADGMAYLEARKYVHRDLAARNCMLGEDLTIKVGDFGMTRDIYETDYYRNGSKGMLPVRWMAPESLADGVFTNQSDVWSFGVVLWEMVTLAEQPYQGLANEQVLALVLGGGILEPPTSAADILRAFMAACWKWRPSARPNFMQLVQWLDKSVELGSQFQCVSFYHSKENSRVEIYPDILSQQLVASWTHTKPFHLMQKQETEQETIPKLSPPPKKMKFSNESQLL